MSLSIESEPKLKTVLEDLLSRRILLMDGAMATMI